MTTREKQQRVIEDWMNTIVRDGGIDRYDDLHIDRIDSLWAHREHWLESGLKALYLARSARDERKLAVTVALAFSLKSGEEAVGVNFSTPDEFLAQLDWSPPSLYLFRPSHEPWIISACEEGRRQLDPDILFATIIKAVTCYYMEYRQPESPEYSRSVFLVG